MILGTERYSHVSLAKVAIVGVGVVIASYGDSDANVRGIVVQVGAIICDAVRCTLLQMVMQNSRVKLSPVGTLFYIAPIATLGLCLPAGLVELPQLYFHDPPIPWVWLMASCAAATSLNLIGFTLIGKTSALTTSVTGPLKSWICIVAAMFTFNTPVSLQQWCGYCVAFCGIMWYQYDKFWSKRPVKSDLAKLLEKATPEHVQTAKDQNGH
jgi:drug/metabolite transporter (DMT)-like permease